MDTFLFISGMAAALVVSRMIRRRLRKEHNLAALADAVARIERNVLVQQARLRDDRPPLSDRRQFQDMQAFLLAHFRGRIESSQGRSRLGEVQFSAHQDPRFGVMTLHYWGGVPHELLTFPVRALNQITPGSVSAFYHQIRVEWERDELARRDPHFERPRVREPALEVVPGPREVFMYGYGHGGGVEPMAGGYAAVQQMAGINRQAAIDKAKAYLRVWLSPEQLAEYDQHGFFHVKGNVTGKRYRIRNGGDAYNIDEYGDDGAICRKLCFVPVPEDVLEPYPPGDVMVMQKLTLEHDEVEALRVANPMNILRVTLPDVPLTPHGQRMIEVMEASLQDAERAVANLLGQSID